jgi:glycosyl transferase family 2
MNPSVLVSIPTLGRPQNIERLVASAHASLEHYPHRILYLCSPGDRDTILAASEADCEVRVVPWQQPAPADWARKQNLAYREMTEDWMLLGGDDIVFHPDWFYYCLKAAAQTSPGACVVGTNDLGNERTMRGQHSTHPLVHRDYIRCGGVVDDPEKLLPECYGHWFVDDEFVRTAMARRTYVHAFEARVEHLHPCWGKAADDATYRQGQASIHSDAALFRHRSHLWDPRQTQGRR